MTANYKALISMMVFFLAVPNILLAQYFSADDSTGHIAYLTINLLSLSYNSTNEITTALTALTSKNAACKYDTKNVPFEQMNFGMKSLDQAQRHHAGFLTYVDEQEGTYYVSCKSEDGYAAASIPFQIRIADAQCEESWACGAWRECENGLQTRICMDINKCGTEGKKPREFQTCIKECNELWQCGSWTSCSDGTSYRECYDLNQCGSENAKPAEYEMCESIPQCYNSLNDNNEEGIDCGSPCNPCVTCFDRIKNQDEEGIDCGGQCRACNDADFMATGEIIRIAPEQPQDLSFFLMLVVVSLVLFSAFGIYHWFRMS